MTALFVKKYSKILFQYILLNPEVFLSLTEYINTCNLLQRGLEFVIYLHSADILFIAYFWGTLHFI
jgi:hypothetical protein